MPVASLRVRLETWDGCPNTGCLSRFCNLTSLHNLTAGLSSLRRSIHTGAEKEKRSGTRMSGASDKFNRPRPASVSGGGILLVIEAPMSGPPSDTEYRVSASEHLVTCEKREPRSVFMLTRIAVSFLQNVGLNPKTSRA